MTVVRHSPATGWICSTFGAPMKTRLPVGTYAFPSASHESRCLNHLDEVAVGFCDNLEKVLVPSGMMRWLVFRTCHLRTNCRADRPATGYGDQSGFSKLCRELADVADAERLAVELGVPLNGEFKVTTWLEWATVLPSH